MVDALVDKSDHEHCCICGQPIWGRNQIPYFTMTVKDFGFAKAFAHPGKCSREMKSKFKDWITSTGKENIKGEMAK